MKIAVPEEILIRGQATRSYQNGLASILIKTPEGREMSTNYDPLYHIIKYKQRRTCDINDPRDR
jgi:hypothetical protein